MFHSPSSPEVRDGLVCPGGGGGAPMPVSLLVPLWGPPCHPSPPSPGAAPPHSPGAIGSRSFCPCGVDTTPWGVQMGPSSPHMLPPRTDYVSIPRPPPPDLSVEAAPHYRSQTAGGPSWLALTARGWRERGRGCAEPAPPPAWAAPRSPQTQRSRRARPSDSCKPASQAACGFCASPPSFIL